MTLLKCLVLSQSIRYHQFGEPGFFPAPESTDLPHTQRVNATIVSQAERDSARLRPGAIDLLEALLVLPLTGGPYMKRELDQNFITMKLITRGL